MQRSFLALLRKGVSVCVKTGETAESQTQAQGCSIEKNLHKIPLSEKKTAGSVSKEMPLFFFCLKKKKPTPDQQKNTNFLGKFSKSFQ